MNNTVMRWQPIETAPREVEVIVFDKNNDPPVFTAQRIYGEWSASVEDRYAPEDDYFGDPPKHPTKWMHLPGKPDD